MHITVVFTDELNAREANIAPCAGLNYSSANDLQAYSKDGIPCDAICT